MSIALSVMRRNFLLILTSMLGACTYNVRFEECSIQCSTETGCPDGLTCGAEGRCRSDAHTDECVLPSDGTGGVITHVNGRTIHTFSTIQSGSVFTPSVELNSVELLVVAGGGGGGSTRGGGGGGAGGLLYMASFAVSQTSHVVMVGYGGATATIGGNSSFGTIVAVGGGAGRPCTVPDGGSGGGADHDANHGPGGAGTAGEGNGGGASGFNSGSTTFTGAGGGGAGGPGGVGIPSIGGAGGPGLVFSISGEQVYYAGGGGGGAQDLGANGLSSGTGGLGGGADGGLNAIGKDGVDGTGGGGGGGGAFLAGGKGGNGVVIVAYPTMH